MKLGAVATRAAGLPFWKSYPRPQQALIGEIMKLVLIKWKDPCSFAIRWTDRDDFSEADIVSSMSSGILLRETKGDITVCLSLNIMHYSQAITIPKSSIEKMWQVKVVKIIGGKASEMSQVPEGSLSKDRDIG